MPGLNLNPLARPPSLGAGRQGPFDSQGPNKMAPPDVGGGLKPPKSMMPKPFNPNGGPMPMPGNGDVGMPRNGGPLMAPPQTPSIPFPNPLTFDQRRANAMALYGPRPGNPGADVGGQADPPMFGGGGGDVGGGPIRPPVQAGGGMGMPPDIMGVIQRLMQSNPQVLLQMLAPYMNG